MIYYPPSFLTFVVNDKVNDAVNTMVIYTNGKLKAWEPELADFLIAQFGHLLSVSVLAKRLSLTER